MSSTPASGRGIRSRVGDVRPAHRASPRRARA